MTRHQLSITKKILLIAATFTVPIAVLLYFVVANINEFIVFGEQEIRGNEFQRPVEDTLDSLQRTQLAYLDCPEGRCGDKLNDVLSRVDEGFSKVLDKAGKLAEALQFTDTGLGKRDRNHIRPSVVAEEWKQLRADLVGGAATVAADIGSRFDHLSSDLRTMITHSGDTSNLILDPDLDSYYLMDVTLLALPQNQDRLAKVTTFGRGLMGAANIKPEDRMALAVRAALLQESDLDRILHGLSPSLDQNLKPQLDTYKAAVSRFIAMTSQLAESEAPGFDRTAYLAAANEARSASFALWNVAVEELDNLITKRLDSYRSRRTWAFALSAAAVFISLLLTSLVGQSITQPLTKLARAMDSAASALGNAVGRIKATPAKAAEVTEDLNKQATEVRHSVGELTSLIYGGDGLPPEAARTTRTDPASRKAA
jgi:methyl-accepting chemotaxis protein